MSAAEAARLGGELTPMGAERAGNAAGTIPAWTGGITTPPSGFVPGEREVDPYPDDPVLYTITAEDIDAHAGVLSDGQKALLRAYPETWHMNVYPTRRSASFPEWVYAAVRENATHARVVLEGKGSVADARIGPPFPIPNSGVEAIWNHLLRWRGARVDLSDGSAAVTRTGAYRVVLSDGLMGVPYGGREVDAFGKEFPNVLLALRSMVISPARVSGDATLVIEPIDQTNDPRKSWQYSRNLRRVFRNPWLGYDFPAQYSDGLRTVDDFWLFNGPPDRFDWTLVGKRELLIPYNAYRLHSSSVGPAEILGLHHIEPNLARYELHRVWVVEATLKPGAKHIYSRRVFYIDEDSWQIAASESYDAKGGLWRVNEAHALNYYEVPVLWSTLDVFNDLEEDRYLVMGLDNQRGTYHFSEGSDPREFSPNALTYFVR
ncbi:MAG: DUF1329 domain-containing protein [bacterium]